MIKWDDKEVKSWAKKYTRKGVTLYTIEYDIGVSHSTLWWCFTHRLEDIDASLFITVNKKLKRRCVNA